MKNPRAEMAAGAFRVTSDATLTSPSDATDALTPTRKNERRYFWSNISNACEPLRVRRGTIEHE